MTDYTITTNFGAKDDLPSGNAAKVIKGEEFTTEFTNIQTAVNTKADTAGDTFTGVVNFSADVAVNTNTLFVDVSEAKVGIGTNSPARELSIGNGTGSPNIQLLAASSGNSRIEFGDTDDSDAGEIQYVHSDNYMQFTTNGSEAVRINSSGNVGIGTNSPQRKLHVESEVRIQGTYPKLEFVDTDNNPDFTIIGGNAQLQFYDETNATSRMNINSSGNVGIGTTSPTQALSVSAANNSQQITFGRTGTSVGHGTIGADSTGAFGIWNSADAKLVSVLQGGNVGIGTTSPSTTLDVHSSTNGHGLYIAQDNAGDNYHTRLTFQGSNGSGGFNTIAGLKAYQETNGTNGYLRFDTNGDTERMRIDASGNVLVGTTSATANAKLKVAGAAILDDSVTYTKNYNTLSTTGVVVAKATGGSNGSSTTFIFTGQGGSGAPFHIVFSCRNQGGQWFATRSEISASASVDVVASTSGNDVLFTFKSKSGTQGYSPKVKITTVGINYDTTYLA